jgi:hypothetical protein
MPTTMRPIPSQPPRNVRRLATTGDGAGLGVAPGAGGEHAEEEVAAAELLVGHAVHSITGDPSGSELPS